MDFGGFGYVWLGFVGLFGFGQGYIRLGWDLLGSVGLFGFGYGYIRLGWVIFGFALRKLSVIIFCFLELF